MAELVVDEVTGRVIGPEENESAWREVEVELGPAAPPGMLDEVETGWVLRGCAGRRLLKDRASARRPLAERAAGSAEAAPPGSAGASWSSYLGRRLARCVAAIRWCG